PVINPPPHSFPTRRSSDLQALGHQVIHPGHGVGDIGNAPLAGEFFPVGATEATAAPVVDVQEGKAPGGPELDLEIEGGARRRRGDRKSTRLNSSHVKISYA